MQSATSIVEILWRYKNHEFLSGKELNDLRLWLEESREHEDLLNELRNEKKWERDIADLLAKDSNATWNKIQKRVQELSGPVPVREGTWRQYAIAASVVILLGATILVISNKKPAYNKITTKAEAKREIYPASNTALLTLDNGMQIRLDSTVKGDIAMEENTLISKSDAGGLNYLMNKRVATVVRHNRLSTGKGNVFRLTLPDGTNVWLNSISSLRYPVNFSGVEREVELMGEAYFEVAKNRQHPFIVKTANSSIRVLGTHFNINAYPEENAMIATLLEGSVLVSNGHDSASVKPGQQAQVNRSGSLTVDSANVQRAVAWRNRLFWFQQTTFDEIMFQISRQYDIEVSYIAPVYGSFSGILPQNLPLSNLLDMLEKGGNVHFTLEGKKIVVRP
jgi:transmembrane sensor